MNILKVIRYFLELKDRSIHYSDSDIEGHVAVDINLRVGYNTLLL